MKTIAVLITSFNRKKITLKCLEKLFSQNFKACNLEVYLVDDGSTDGTFKAVSKQFPDINILKGNGNLFWNRGMYTAWEEAAKKEWDFYLWLNDDTFLFENAIQSMLDTFSKVDKNSIIVGATCSNLNHELTTYGGRDGKTVVQNRGQIIKCSTFNGNFVLIPNSVYNKLGNLDYKFSHSFGDIEYGMRAIKNKINIYIAPSHIGTCESHDSVKLCFSPKVSFLKRLKHFYSPLGMNPLEFFYMNRKYKGLPLSIKVFITTHLRVIFPKIWLS